MRQHTRNRKRGMNGYLFRRWHLFDLLVKNLLYSSPHLCDGMVGSIEGYAILENQADIGNELVRMIISRVSKVRVGFEGIGRNKFAIDGRKVHRLFDDNGVVRDIEGNVVNREIERRAILQLLESANSGCTETILSTANCRSAMIRRRFGSRRG